MENQRTINKPVSFTGIGLHTGNNTTITFNPAPANTGFVFVRKDLEPNVEIPALVDYVVDLSRGTTLGKDGVLVHTVEHVLAALVGLKIDNCRIELSANEPPVLDGSAMPYVDALMKAGITELDEPREYYVVDETIHYKNEEKAVDIVALPTDDYRITVMIDYFIPALGSQHTGMFDLEKEFITEFAPARTFCFLTEVISLFESGLIKGGGLDNAIIIVDKDLDHEELNKIQKLFKLETTPFIGKSGILNDIKLRFKNEPARHKLLDMLGDLALIGVPIKAQILAARPGHASNIEFAKIIRSKYLKSKTMKRYDVSKTDKIALDIRSILKILPHRYPILLVDRVVEINKQKQTILTYKNVTMNEEFFLGHFPGNPVMPGVLIIEALAQSGGILLAHLIDDYEKKIAFFMGIKNAKFRKTVIPGDQLVMEVECTGKRFNAYMFNGKGYVNQQLVVEVEFQAAILDRENE